MKILIKLNRKFAKCWIVHRSVVVAIEWEYMHLQNENLRHMVV